MIIVPLLTTSLIRFSWKGWENVLFELGSERLKRQDLARNSIIFILENYWLVSSMHFLQPKFYAQGKRSSHSRSTSTRIPRPRPQTLTNGSDVNLNHFAASSSKTYNRLQNSWDTLQNFGIFVMKFALELKNMPFAKFTPASLINVDQCSFRHYGHFVSGQRCAGGGGGGDVLLGIGIFENPPKHGRVPLALQPIVVSLLPFFCGRNTL